MPQPTAEAEAEAADNKVVDADGQTSKPQQRLQCNQLPSYSPLPISTLVTLPVQLVLPLLALKRRTGVKSAYKMTAGWQVSVSACLCVYVCASVSRR